MEKKNIAKRVAMEAMLVALAMIFSYVENLVPISAGIPGVKLGLANLVVLLGLYFLKPGEVFGILTARILLAGLLFGNLACIIYSLSGGVLSFLIMWILSRRKFFSVTGISIAGGVSHNIGQLLMAMLVVHNLRLIAYGPVLLISGAVCGTLIGLVGQRFLYYKYNDKQSDM